MVFGLLVRFKLVIIAYNTSLHGDTATRLNFNKSMYTLLLTGIKIKYHVPVLCYTGMTGSELSAAVTVVSVVQDIRHISH